MVLPEHFAGAIDSRERFTHFVSGWKTHPPKSTPRNSIRGCFESIGKILDSALDEGELDLSSSSSSAGSVVRTCFCVREGTSGLLDVARETLTQTLEQIHELFRCTSNLMKCPSLLHSPTPHPMIRQ